MRRIHYRTLWIPVLGVMRRTSLSITAMNVWQGGRRSTQEVVEGQERTAVHRHDAKTFRADGLNSLLDLTGGFANESLFRACRFPFLATCDHPSVS
jgi:hypothetical protein